MPILEPIYTITPAPIKHSSLILHGSNFLSSLNILFTDLIGSLPITVLSSTLTLLPITVPLCIITLCPIMQFSPITTSSSIIANLPT